MYMRQSASMGWPIVPQKSSNRKKSYGLCDATNIKGPLKTHYSTSLFVVADYNTIELSVKFGKESLLQFGH